jgi:hypothetical protein
MKKMLPSLQQTLRHWESEEVVISAVASKDGTTIYTAPLSSPATEIDPTRLIQIGKLVKIDQLHLKTFPDPTATPPRTSLIGGPRPGSTQPELATILLIILSLSPFRYPLSSAANTHSPKPFNSVRAVKQGSTTIITA